MAKARLACGFLVQEIRDRIRDCVEYLPHQPFPLSLDTICSSVISAASAPRDVEGVGVMLVELSEYLKAYPGALSNRLQLSVVRLYQQVVNISTYNGWYDVDATSIWRFCNIDEVSFDIIVHGE